MYRSNVHVHVVLHIQGCQKKSETIIIPFKITTVGDYIDTHGH